MQFDIFNYSIPLALGAFAFFLILCLFLFRRYTTSIADPLVLHILWLSSLATFFVIYAERHSVSLFYVIFACSLIVYVISLLIFFPIYAHKKLWLSSRSVSGDLQGLAFSETKWKLMVFVLLLMVLYSMMGFFQYALTCQSPAELFSYRFVSLQGRNGVERIVGNAGAFLNLFLFYGIHKNICRKFSFTIVLLLLILGIVSGGRSALIALIFAIGTYVFYFANEIKRDFIDKVNRVALAFVLLGVLLSIVVSSFYEVDGTLETAALTIFNRVFAGPDGLEYYLNYAGESNIKMGLVPYFLSVFGIYVKNIIGVDVKNIGWQLTELVVGNVDFAQGSNYTFLLQSVVFNYYLAPIYTVFIAWFVTKLRYVYTSKLKLMPLYYVLSTLAFLIAIDLEYFTFLIVSVLIIQLVVVFPIMRLRI